MGEESHRCALFRERLKSCLRECGFEVVDLGNLFVREEAASEEPRPRKEVLYDLYQKVDCTSATVLCVRCRRTSLQPLT